ncbi:MAG: rhodanese-like domain-containing protein [Bacteroidales bacterium]|jgi:rhodanese-related sulfurtransferase|nr:rhodanese-like domain-containing protein [Bacteroidales bacterium]
MQNNHKIYIQPAKAWELLQQGEGILLDIRSKEEINDRKIDCPEQICIPFDKLQSQIENLPKERLLFICCLLGIQSFKAYKMLVNEGLVNILILKGGILEWQNNQLPIKISESTCCKCQTQTKI